MLFTERDAFSAAVSDAAALDAEIAAALAEAAALAAFVDAF